MEWEKLIRKIFLKIYSLFQDFSFFFFLSRYYFFRTVLGSQQSKTKGTEISHVQCMHAFPNVNIPHWRVHLL